MVRSLGILGGSFNPVHVGHLAAARGARRALRLERVLFVPSGRPPHKNAEDLADARHRVAMLRLALEGEEGFELCEIEVRRRAVSYTVDTVRTLRERFGGDCRIVFLIGADTVGELATWREIGALLDLCEITPVVRPGADLAAARERLAAAVGPERAEAVCGRLIRIPPVAVSSTEIRARRARGESIAGLVPEAVRAYIERHGLYR